jgi:hypothetical protein
MMNIIEQKRKTMNNIIKKLFVGGVVAVLVLAQMPMAINVSAQAADVVHWSAQDARVPTGQNYVDLVFTLDWASTPQRPVNAVGLTLSFPVGAFTLESSQLTPGVEGFLTANEPIVIPTEPPQGAQSFTIMGMQGFEGETQFSARLNISSSVLVNEGDYITITMLRAAMAGNAYVITGVTIVRCNCDSTCSICEDAGGPPNIPGDGSDGGSNGGSNGGSDGGSNGGSNGGSGGGSDGGSGGGSSGGTGGGSNNARISPGPGVNPSNPAVPRTGDEANMVLWIVLFAIGLFGVVSIAIKLVMNRRNQNDTPSITIEGDDDQEVIINK